jgi:hypothetical protein
MRFGVDVKKKFYFSAPYHTFHIIISSYFPPIAKIYPLFILYLAETIATILM